MNNFHSYIRRTRTTAIYPAGKALDYLVLGLCSEAGEVAGVHKKYIRGDKTHYEYKKQLIKELGDVLWYWCRIVDELHLEPEQIMKENISKLERRQLEGSLKGDGDDR